jgi:mono/diheme cytochrome c family protein
MRFALPLLLLLPAVATAAEVQFNRDVRPILSENCFACHGPDQKKVKGKLRLDVERSAKGEAKSGAAAVVPGDPKSSELLKRIAAAGQDHMPPAETGKSLTKEQVTTLTKWIEQGAKWEDHWAFTPIRRPAEVASGKEQFAKQIDAFVNAKLKEKGLTPAADADRVTLLRRLTFDLTGLPPTPKEVEDFLRDTTPGAYEAVVDRLLASPAYGERMAAFWLDVVRYADSVGYHGDQPVSVWPYRDWVVKAFNDNMKFDEFTRWQLGGDLLPTPTQDQKVAAGYNRLGMMSAEGGVQPKEYLAKYAAERVRAVGGGWLGLTTGCCECHDHKFDPISLKEFYRLEAFFADIQEQGLYGGSNFGSSMAIATPEQEKKLADLDAAAKTREKQSAAVKVLAGGFVTPSADKSAKEAKAARDGFERGLPSTLITVAVPPRPIRVLPRGNWMDDTGEVVEPGVPAVLPQPAKKDKRLTRLDLADWLVSKENPLTARVLANRLWKQFFGAGLARKMDDLGSQGEPPTHPELLDALAYDLRETWDVKRFVKTLLMTAAYRRSSVATAEHKENDAFNLYLARQNRWRLDAEMVRDSVLSVSGLLVNKLGGPPAKPYQPRGYWAFLNFPTREWQNDTGDGLYRRTLYTHWQRQYLHPTLLAFDAPTREECTADRVRSNTPLQSLVLLNAPEFVEAARVFAERVVTDGGATTDERIDFAFKLALSRTAKPVEKETLAALLQKHREQYAKDAKAADEVLKTGAKPANAKLDKTELAAWTSVTRTILNLHAGVTRN